MTALPLAVPTEVELEFDRRVDALATTGLREPSDDGRIPSVVVPPAEALPRLTAAGRSRAGDERAPAVWVSARRPRPGWCCQGAPRSCPGSVSYGA